MTHVLRIMTEEQTLEEAFTRSIARVGDGEFRIALGGQAPSQIQHPRLRAELLALLEGPTASVVCLPRINAPHVPKMWFWKKYDVPKYKAICKQRVYGSTWITRPDDAPWINTPTYWERVVDLWRGKDVVLVTGDEKSLTPQLLSAASSVRVVKSIRQHAYQHIDEIEEQIGVVTGPVLMCLGATATVLAERLAMRDIHALDLGHLGMFMKRREKNLMNQDDVASPEYRALLRDRYTRPGWGASGHHHANTVAEFARQLNAATVLDYGCGRGRLKEALAERAPNLIVHEYDPGIEGKDRMPEPVDLVVCTDVLEHIEKDRLKNVLFHLRTLARRGLYLIIATGPARETLADGRNAHLIQQPYAWWLRTLREHGFAVKKVQERKGLHVWVTQ